MYHCNVFLISIHFIMVDSNNSNSPEAVRQVNWEAVCTIEVIEEVVDDVHGDMDGIDAMGKNSAPIVTGVSRSLKFSILSSFSCSSSFSSILLMVFRTVWLITSSFSIVSKAIKSLEEEGGSGEVAGLGVEMFDICFFNCRNLWNLLSYDSRAETEMASLNMVSRPSIIIIMVFSWVKNIWRNDFAGNNGQCRQNVQALQPVFISSPRQVVLLFYIFRL